MKLNRNWLIAIALGCSVFCESMAYTYVQQEGQTYFYSSSILYFLAGIMICLLPLFSNKEQFVVGERGYQIQKYLPATIFVFLIGLFIYHIHLLAPLYKQIPVDRNLADMLPVIQLACKRLLHGQPVYAPTPEIWPGTVNAYLPMMWLPYLPAEIFDYDLRWTTVTFLFGSLFIAAIPVFRAKKNIPLVPMCIAGVSLFLTLNFFLAHVTNNSIWTMSEEGVVAGFYILLSFALLRQNYYLIGFSIALCLLSRYALAPWIPVYFIFVFFTQPRANFKKLLVTFSAVVLAVFIIPYFIWDPLYFLSLPGIQAGHTNWFWSIHNMDVNVRSYNNVGLYKFFTLDNVQAMVKIELITSFILPVLFILIAKKLQNRYHFDDRYIAYGSLKLSLVFFYNFIPTPYMYLFFPVTLVSYVVLFDFISTQTVYQNA